MKAKEPERAEHIVNAGVKKSSVRRGQIIEGLRSSKRTVNISAGENALLIWFHY